jgi:hypothetical protein
MTLIERVDLAPAHLPYDSSDSLDSSALMPGLRISIQRASSSVSSRCTTSSFSDYAEWNPEEHEAYRRGLITDGACS